MLTWLQTKITKIHRGIRLGIILLIAGIIFSILSNPYDNLQIQPFTILNKNRETIAGKLYLPNSKTTPFPVVILGHGINNSKQHAHLWGVEFARNGIAAIAFDFRGFGESSQLPKSENLVEQLTVTTQEDTRDIYDYIQKTSQQFDTQKIGIIGHSMGGNTALEFAKNYPDIRSTVTMSYGSEVTPTAPKNLLFALGIYEQLNPIHKLREIFISSALPESKSCNPREICGDFATGTARHFSISPTSDHIIAPFDPYLIRETIAWTRKSFNLPDREIIGFKIHLFIFAQSLIFIGSLIIGVYCLQNYPIWIKGIGLLAIGIWLFNKISIASPDRSSFLLCFLFFLLFLSDYATRNPRTWAKKIIILLLYIGAGLTILFIATFFSNIRELFDRPDYLLYLPKFFLQYIFFIAYNVILKIRLILTPTYTMNLTISPWFWIPVIVETLYPRKIVGFLESIGSAIVNWLRQPFRWGFTIPTGKEAIVLGCLGVILTIIVIVRIQDGLLSEAIERSNVFIPLLFKTILLPIFLLVWTIRSRWFRRLESRILSEPS